MKKVVELCVGMYGAILLTNTALAKEPRVCKESLSDAVYYSYYVCADKKLFIATEGHYKTGSSTYTQVFSDDNKYVRCECKDLPDTDNKFFNLSKDLGEKIIIKDE